jgi:hypothetical protein
MDNPAVYHRSTQVLSISSVLGILVHLIAPGISYIHASGDDSKAGGIFVSITQQTGDG